jgi:Ser/Thr protein kinase RdoA (MazF antagonist)
MIHQPLGMPVAVGRTAEIFAWDDGHILKLYRDWCPANWVEYESKIGRIVHAAGLPVPAIGEIVEHAGRRGIIYERIAGISMLTTFRTKPWTILTLGRSFAELHAAMHACAVPSDLPAQHTGFQHSIANAPHLPDNLRNSTLRTLTALPSGDQLCHGDFHPGNVLLTARGPIIIDWMTATRGNPLADAARTMLLLTISEPPSVIERILIRFARRKFIADYIARYFELHPRDDAQLAAWHSIVAAARLSERIPGEKNQLLKCVTGNHARHLTNASTRAINDATR